MHFKTKTSTLILSSWIFFFKKKKFWRSVTSLPASGLYGSRPCMNLALYKLFDFFFITSTREHHNKSRSMVVHIWNELYESKGRVFHVSWLQQKRNKGYNDWRDIPESPNNFVDKVNQVILNVNQYSLMDKNVNPDFYHFLCNAG